MTQGFCACPPITVSLCESLTSSAPLWAGSVRSPRHGRLWGISEGVPKAEQNTGRRLDWPPSDQASDSVHLDVSYPHSNTEVFKFQTTVLLFLKSTPQGLFLTFTSLCQKGTLWPGLGLALSDGCWRFLSRNDFDWSSAVSEGEGWGEYVEVRTVRDPGPHHHYHHHHYYYRSTRPVCVSAWILITATDGTRGEAREGDQDEAVLLLLLHNFYDWSAPSSYQLWWSSREKWLHGNCLVFLMKRYWAGHASPSFLLIYFHLIILISTSK